MLDREFEAAARRLTQAEGWRPEHRVEGVHEFRRSVKRLRAALALSAHVVGQREWKSVDAALSAAARRLGSLRDAHARRAAAQRLVRLLPRSIRALAMDAWRASGGAVTEAAAEPSEEIVHRLVRASAIELRAIRDRVTRWDLQGLHADHVVEAVTRAWGRARDRFRASWRERENEWLHGARKRAQRCASLLVLVQGWDGKIVRASERRLRAAAGLLGQARDAELMLERLGDPELDPALRAVAGRLRSASERHAARCLRQARREGVAALREGRKQLRGRLRVGLKSRR